MIQRLAAGLLLFAWLVGAHAQQSAKVYRIGFVGSTSSMSTFEAFRQGLREAGYVEGKNVIIEARFAEGRQGRLPELVAEVLRLKIDVLVCGSTNTVLAAKKATTTVPIVFASVFDPVQSGIVTSLPRPGGNVTGTALGVGGSDFAGKWVEVLREASPQVSRVAVLYNAANPASSRSVNEIHPAARTLNVKLDIYDARNVASLDASLTAIETSGAQGVIVTNDPLFTANRVKLVRFAADKRLPAIYFFRAFAEVGGLLTYGPSFEESYRKAATYVDKILKGAKPADLPVEQSTRFELIINLRAAKAIGLLVPQSLLVRADQIIE